MVETAPVELTPPVPKLPVASDKPVANLVLDEVVTLATLIVALVAVALEFHVNGG